MMRARTGLHPVLSPDAAGPARDSLMVGVDMTKTRRLLHGDEHFDQNALDRIPTMSAAVMERRRRFARVAREIAGRTPCPWDLDVVELLRGDRRR